MTYRLPSLNSLRAFEAAARHLSFRDAAKEIGVTSGAISQQVRKLEESLGVELFIRLAHGLLLTNEGETYQPKITKLFEDLTAATEEIAPEMNGKKFSVGVSRYVLNYLPSGWPTRRGSELEPFVRDRVETSDVAKVKNGEIDCLVCNLNLNDDEFDHGLSVLQIDEGDENNQSLVLVSKVEFIDCRQIEAIVSSLRAELRFNE